MQRSRSRLVLVSLLLFALGALWWWTRPLDRVSRRRGGAAGRGGFRSAGSAGGRGARGRGGASAARAGLGRPRAAHAAGRRARARIRHRPRSGARRATRQPLLGARGADAGPAPARRARPRARALERDVRQSAGGRRTKEEIEAYFDHRQRLSSDYVRVVDYLSSTTRRPSRKITSRCSTPRGVSISRVWQEIPRRLQEAYDRGKTQKTRAQRGAQQQDSETEETPNVIRYHDAMQRHRRSVSKPPSQRRN